MAQERFSVSSGANRAQTAVLAVWLALTVILFGLGAENTLLPGLYYDEAVFGGLAKDFVDGPPHGRHMPNTETVAVFGRPFPLFVQSYLGAVKSWPLIPAIALFGPTVPVLRLANVCWSAAGLLFFILWTRRVAGLSVALPAAVLLTLDPAFFFTSILDWGAVVPSLLFRFAAFFFAARAWQEGKARDALLAGICGGVGIFNKIDFAIVLAAVAVGATIALGRSLVEFVVGRRALLTLAGAGFLLGAGLMLPHVWGIFAVHSPAHAGEWQEKSRILLMMCDGSYFYRLMANGGRFETMFATPSAVWTPFGLVFLISSVGLAVGIFRRSTMARLSLFLLLTLLCAIIGFMLLPGALRLHHALVVMPFPQLIIATALAAAWRDWPNLRVALAAAFVVLLGWQTAAILRTQRLIRETGGRGPWSQAMVQFCREVKDQSNLTIISLDWGFNEQLLFLTQGPRLEEPIWNWVEQPTQNRSNPPADPNLIYLFHPDLYSKFGFGAEFARLAPPAGKRLVVQTWRDAQAQPAFYSARFVDKEIPP